MPNSRYYIWVIYDVEAWSRKPAVHGARIQEVLHEIEHQAFLRTGIDPNKVERQPTGDGAVLAIPGDISKELVTTKFVDAVRESVEAHDASCPPGEVIRLRLALHAGDGLPGDGEWAGPGVVLASRLVNSPLLRRVLKAATGSALALIVSDDWYQSIIRQGLAPADGYRQVLAREPEKDFSSLAWVRVPGRGSPPGLTPGDLPGSGAQGSPASPAPGHSGSQPSVQAAGETVTVITGSPITGGVSIGNHFNGPGFPGGGAR